MKGNVIVGQSGGPTSAINSSLAGVYRTAIDRGAPKVYGMLHGIQGLLDEKYVDLSEHIRNDLEPVVVREYPQLETIRQHLLLSGAACARMSGSGSSMFGLFSARHAAEAAVQNLASLYGKVFVLPMNAGM